MVQMHLLTKQVDAVSIVGNIEWFDLINETIQGFLIIPLYAMFSRYKNRKEAIYNGFLTSNVIYFLFSIVVYCFGNQLIKQMQISQNISETVEYLQLETIAFIIANIFSVCFVIFVIIGKARYVYMISCVQIIMNIIGYKFFIPLYAANGVAYTKILTNSVIIMICLYMLFKENLLYIGKIRKTFLKDYFQIGIFSGGQVFLDNIMYGLLVCRMVNKVHSQGTYWIVNNLIWGFFLIPCNAISEIIKREKKISAKVVRWVVLSFIAWIPFICKMDVFLRFVINTEQITQAKNTLLILLPFYVVYVIANCIDSLFVGQGKTWKVFIISLVVNCVYYPVSYCILRQNEISLSQICIMFGCGMIVHCVVALLLLSFSSKINSISKVKENVKKL